MNPFDVAWAILKMGAYEDLHGDMALQELASLPLKHQMEVVSNMVRAGLIDERMAHALLDDLQPQSDATMGATPGPQTQAPYPVRTGYPMDFGGSLDLLKTQVMKAGPAPFYSSTYQGYDEDPLLAEGSAEEEEELPEVDEDEAAGAVPGEPTLVQDGTTPGPEAPVKVKPPRGQTTLEDFE